MSTLRLWLACVWLVFATVTPAHAAIMSQSFCDHMAMPMAPAHHAPVNGDSLPCCSVPDVIRTDTAVILAERIVTFVKLAPPDVPRLRGINPVSDPDPPKNPEA